MATETMLRLTNPAFAETTGGVFVLKSEAMLTTKKVLEEAIKVRSDKIQVLEKQMDDDLEGLDHVFSEPAIKKLQTEIAELKQSLQIIYDANKL